MLANLYYKNQSVCSDKKGSIMKKIPLCSIVQNLSRNKQFI